MKKEIFKFTLVFMMATLFAWVISLFASAFVACGLVVIFGLSSEYALAITLALTIVTGIVLWPELMVKFEELI